MLYRENTLLGKRVSAIGFGGAAISGEGGGYGFGEMDENQAEKLIKELWEAGINLYDTAPIYGFGLSEERMGKYLSKDAIVVSKAGVDWHPNRRVNMSNEPKIVEKMLLESLKRLKREYIDVYMIHWPDPRVDIRRAVEVLRKYQEKSVINHVGLCNTNLDELTKAREIGPIDCLQSELNFLNSKAFDDLGEEWKQYFSMGWGTFDKGILSGRVTEGRKYDTSDARSWAPWWNKKEVTSKIQRVQNLQSILNEYDLSLSSFCLNYNLSAYGIDSTLIGMKSLSDFEAIKESLKTEIPSMIMVEIVERFRSK